MALFKMDHCLFLSLKRWIFQENESKKKKVLDMCADAAS
jgi:hypothetical protein